MMKQLTLAGAGMCAVALLSTSWMRADEPEKEIAFSVNPIGHVRKSEQRTLIVLNKKYEPGLLGLDGFSHIHVFWWFDRNDTPEKRSVLQVHPRGNRDNPLTGVFATRSPMRPNLIALTLCKVVSVKNNIIEIEGTDALNGTPVLDIKPFIPGYDSAEDATIPEWLEKSREKREAPQKSEAAAADGPAAQAGAEGGLSLSPFAVVHETIISD